MKDTVTEHFIQQLSQVALLPKPKNNRCAARTADVVFFSSSGEWAAWCAAASTSIRLRSTRWRSSTSPPLTRWRRRRSKRSERQRWRRSTSSRKSTGRRTSVRMLHLISLTGKTWVCLNFVLLTWPNIKVTLFSSSAQRLLWVQGLLLPGFRPVSVSHGWFLNRYLCENQPKLLVSFSQNEEGWTFWLPHRKSYTEWEGNTVSEHVI